MTAATKNASRTGPVGPVARLGGLAPYAPPRTGHAIDLHLDANEGAGPSRAVRDAIADAGPEALRRYPDASSLEAALARKLGTVPGRVLVTNGGDDAIDRACRAVLEPGRAALLHTPTFEMIPRGVRLSGAAPVEIPWRTGCFPERAFVDAARAEPSIAMIALVTPNNPTGAVIRPRSILRIADAAPRALVLVDLAYTEFADEDPTPLLLERDNVMMVRTFSKAFGLAGLRVGYAVAPEPVIPMLRTTGGPYPVSHLSLVGAEAALGEEDRLRGTVARVRTERARLAELLTALGAEPMPSQANFVTASFADSEGVRAALGARGIAVRGWPARPDLAGLLRITLPADADRFTRLTAALSEILEGRAS